jgi:hypothetical protein
MPDRAWSHIITATFDRDLQLSVIEDGEVYALVFSCRRTANGWIEARSGYPVNVHPTHWREWAEEGPHPLQS